MNPSRLRQKIAEHDAEEYVEAAENCRACIDMTSLLTTANLEYKPKDCPLDSAELGRATWSYLHTLAAYYPSKPSREDQTRMTQFIGTFARFYPCSHCAHDFQQEIAKCPPRVDSRSALSQWFCKQHNTVNAKLGKPIFDCATVMERWRDGWADGRCDVPE